MNLIGKFLYPKFTRCNVLLGRRRFYFEKQSIYLFLMIDSVFISLSVFIFLRKYKMVPTKKIDTLKRFELNLYQNRYFTLYNIENLLMIKGIH